MTQLKYVLDGTARTSREQLECLVPLRAGVSFLR
jgi:hypothetical protein